MSCHVMSQMIETKTIHIRPITPSSTSRTLTSPATRPSQPTQPSQGQGHGHGHGHAHGHTRMHPLLSFFYFSPAAMIFLIPVFYGFEWKVWNVGCYSMLEDVMACSVMGHYVMLCDVM